MARFFVPAEALQSDQAILSGENAAHAKVLRLRPGETITLCDGKGTESLATVAEVSGGQYVLRLQPPQPSKSEPFCRASVYMAYAKADKIDHVVQKATELGAWEIVLFPSSRCVSRPDHKSLRNKLDRWQRIACSAAEQSGRGKIPEVRACDNYSAALSQALMAEQSLFFYENEHQLSMRAALRTGLHTLSLILGPEGGFAPEEVLQAQAAGCLVCTLGPRILRCETAPLCALSAAMFALGEYD